MIRDVHVHPGSRVSKRHRIPDQVALLSCIAHETTILDPSQPSIYTEIRTGYRILNNMINGKAPRSCRLCARWSSTPAATAASSDPGRWCSSQTASRTWTDPSGYQARSPCDPCARAHQTDPSLWTVCARRSSHVLPAGWDRFSWHCPLVVTERCLWPRGAGFDAEARQCCCSVKPDFGKGPALCTSPNTWEIWKERLCNTIQERS